MAGWTRSGRRWTRGWCRRRPLCHGRWSARTCPWRKRRSRWSSGVLVLVDDASDPVASSDPEGFELGYLGWKRFERSGAGQRHVRPVVVVVTLAGRQDPAEVGQVPDEGAVEKLAAASADPPLHDRVHAGHPDAAAHD